jgi:hypothetical protein
MRQIVARWVSEVGRDDFLAEIAFDDFAGARPGRLRPRRARTFFRSDYPGRRWVTNRGWEVWSPKKPALGSPEEYAKRPTELMD